MDAELKIKTPRRALQKYVDEIQCLESNFGIECKNVDLFINDINKNISLPEELIGRLSEGVREESKKIASQKKEFYIKISKLKGVLKNYFKDCMIISISTHSKEFALEILKYLKEQNVIYLGKKTHNKCYYEFIVKKDLKICDKYKDFIKIKSKKVLYADVLDFLNSIKTPNINQVSGDKKYVCLFEKILNIKERIEKLNIKRGEWFFELVKNCIFTEKVREKVSFYTDNHDFLMYILKLDDYRLVIDEFYQKVVQEYKEELSKIDEIKQKHHLDINIEAEKDSILKSIEEKLMNEKNRNINYIEFYLNLSIMESISTMCKKLNDLHICISEKLNYKKYKISCIDAKLNNILKENNIYFYNKRGRNNKEETYIFVDPETDIKSFFNHNDINKFKGNITCN